MTCPICSSPMSEPVEELFALPTITSDCRPWGAGKSVRICSGCGVMQRVTQSDFSGVYKGYKSYPEPQGRTKRILEFVKDKMPAPKRVLDIGAGAGHGMRVMSDFFPEATVFGYEPTIDPDRPKDKFDLITLFHVLEHVEDLHEMLAYIKSSLTENGHVLVQVPYTIMWPFDLVIADHVRHFTAKSLVELFQNFGLNMKYVGNSAINKELTLLAAVNDDDKILILGGGILDCSPIEWLLSYKKFLDGINEPVAVYGTGPAAAWAGNILGDKVVCYFDDNSDRWGGFMGKLVCEPLNNADIKAIAPFPDWQLAEIKAKNPNLRFLC